MDNHQKNNPQKQNAAPKYDPNSAPQRQQQKQQQEKQQKQQDNCCE